MGGTMDKEVPDATTPVRSIHGNRPNQPSAVFCMGSRQDRDAHQTRIKQRIPDRLSVSLPAITTPNHNLPPTRVSWFRPYTAIPTFEDEWTESVRNGRKPGK